MYFQIRPIAKGHLSGFDGNTHYEDIPHLTVTMSDLYPARATFVRVYPGPSSADPVDGRVVSASLTGCQNSWPKPHFSTEPNSQPEIHDFGKEFWQTVYVLINDSIPQDRTLSLKNLDDYFTKEGLPVMKLLPQTPFGTDLRYSSTINVDRTLQFTGSLFSEE